MLWQLTCLVGSEFGQLKEYFNYWKLLLFFILYRWMNQLTRPERVSTTAILPCTDYVLGDAMIAKSGSTTKHND